MLTRRLKLIKNESLTSATRITNYVKKDCIIDYLDLINTKKRKLDFNEDNKKN